MMINDADRKIAMIKKASKKKKIAIDTIWGQQGHLTYQPGQV